MNRTILALLAFGFLHFKTVEAQQIPNGDFELWQIMSNYEVPLNWYSPTEAFISFYQPGNYGLRKTSDAYVGSHALELNSVDRNELDGVDDGYFSAVKTNFATQEKPYRINGYYKSHLLEGDTALIGLFVFHNDTIVGEGAYHITGINQQYTFFEAYIGYKNNDVMPDSLEILAVSTIKNQNFNKQGKIIVDNIKLSYDPWSSAGEEIQKTVQRIVNVGPNPTSGHFRIGIENSNPAVYTVSLYDLLGTKVYEQSNNVNHTGKAELSVDFPSKLANGMYFYEVTSENFRHSSRINLRR